MKSKSEAIEGRSSAPCCASSCDGYRLLKALLRIEEIYFDGCDTYEDWKAMGTIARETLSENDKDLARRAQDSE